MPATLEPPPVKAPAARRSSRDDRPWAQKLTRSGYFLGAVLLHLFIFLVVATWVVFQAPKPPPSDEPVVRYIPSRPVVPPSPPSRPQPSLPATQTPLPSRPVIVGPAKISPFTVPLPSLDANGHLGPLAQGTSLGPMIRPAELLKRRLPGILKFIEDGQHRTSDNIRLADGDIHQYVGTFPVYLASYANGDWNCNVVLKNGAIVAGSLPDLIAKVNEWSHQNIKGTVMPTPLDIGGPDLMAEKPPFIFFTGHKDFVLTDNEIANLRNYLQNGGAIWGDNALPGHGSRFDVAFHREMKRVIPDKDKNFEDVPLTHDIFAKSWFNLTQLAPGMNYYAEPVQHLDLDGKVAILYTPNDYSDLLFMHILPGDTIMGETWALPGGSPLFTNAAFLENSDLFFRNFKFSASLDSQRLGMNIIGFLLVRFDKDLILIP